jgi:thymidylate synthase
MSNKAIAAALGIEYEPEDGVNTEDSLDSEDGDFSEDEISTSAETPESSETAVDVVGELLGPEKKIGHIEEDYTFVRRVMRNTLNKAEEVLDEMIENVKDDPNARSYAVMATMFNTVTDMSSKLFELQKRNKELHAASLSGVGTKPEVNIQNGAVFVGDSATMLDRIKARAKAMKEAEQS